MKFIRIKPYNKTRKQLTRRYVYGGVRFEENHGWYEVDDEIAEYLGKVRTFPEDPDSKLIFDVSDREGAETIAREEYEEANPERKISEAVKGAQTVTLADLDPASVPAPSAKAKGPAPAKPDKGDPEPSAKTKADESGKSKRKGRFDD